MLYKIMLACTHPVNTGMKCLAQLGRIEAGYKALQVHLGSHACCSCCYACLCEMAATAESISHNIQHIAHNNQVLCKRSGPSMPVSSLEVCEPVPVMLTEGGTATVITESLSAAEILTAAGATARPLGAGQGGGAAGGAAQAEKKKARLLKGM